MEELGDLSKESLTKKVGEKDAEKLYDLLHRSNPSNESSGSVLNNFKTDKDREIHSNSNDENVECESEKTTPLEWTSEKTKTFFTENKFPKDVQKHFRTSTMPHLKGLLEKDLQDITNQKDGSRIF